MLTLLEQANHSKGTYFALQPSGATRNRLQDLVSELNIDNAVKPMEYHCTVIYSKTPCPQMRNFRPKLPIWAMGVEFLLFGENKNILVLKLESISLHKLYDDLQIYNPSSDYDQYNPHITLSYNWEEELPKLKEVIPVCFDTFLCTPLED